MQPLYNYVLVRPFEFELKTKSGLLMPPEQNKRAIKTQRGEVIAIGNGMIKPEGGLMPLSVKVGDEVLFIRGTGLDMRQEVDGEEILLFKESELLMITNRTFPGLTELKDAIVQSVQRANPNAQPLDSIPFEELPVRSKNDEFIATGDAAGARVDSGDVPKAL